MGLREQKKLEQRREILDTSIRLFRERGVDETRVVDIVGEVGVSEKTFFNYFTSKNAVLEAFAADQIELYLALLRHERDDTGRSVADRLTQTFRVFAVAQSSDRDFLAAVAVRSGMFFGASGDMQERQKDGQRLLAEIIAQGQGSGELRSDIDPLQSAEILTAVMTMTAMNWLIHWWPADEPLEDRLLGALDVFLSGTLATKPRTRARSTR